MNLRITEICIMLKKSVFVYLFLYITFSVISEAASSDVQWKTRQKNTASGPTYTFLKTDKHANIKWGVRHYIPRSPRILKYTPHIER